MSAFLEPQNLYCMSETTSALAFDKAGKGYHVLSLLTNAGY